MAIWEESTYGSKCSNCAGHLFFDENLQMLSCRSCGSFFDPTTMDFSYQLKVMDKGQASDDDSRVEYLCDNCGATVITDDTTVADICAFCGSPALARRRLTNEFQPEKIIPFKFDKEEAEKKFISWASQYKKAPKNFASQGNVSKMQGVYVPFWLVDAECKVDYVEQYHDQTRRDIFLRKVPFDGAKAIPDALMRAIEPFNYDELVDYHDGYLHGFRAKRYDYSLVNMTDIVFRRLEDYLTDIFKTQTGDGVYSFRNENFSYVKDISQTYAMLPVWFLNYEYDGRNFQYAINGQTGEVQGFDVPFSRFHYGSIYTKKIITTIIAVLVTLAAVAGFAWLCSYFLDFLSYDYLDEDLKINMFTIVAIPLFIAGWIAYSLLKKFVWKKTDEVIKKPVYHIIDDAPDVYEYIDPASVKEE